jgi:hypothetical protein
VSLARLASVALVAALAAACAHPRAPAPPAAEVTVERPPAPAPAPAPDPAASERWARFLAAVEGTCRATWADDETACASAREAADHPRASADCEDHCGTARRLAIAEELPAAIDACAAKSGTSVKSACARLRAGRSASRMLEEAVERCEDGCEGARAQARSERNRPKTRAEELACLRACVGRHGGAKLVVEPGGDFHVEATGWCGTPAFTCAVNCAPASGEARFRL